jgi:hypothetical protein
VNKLIFAVGLVIGIGAGAVDSCLLADTIVLAPTGVSSSYAGDTFANWGATIDNSGLSASVGTGPVPATWPTGTSFGTLPYPICGRFTGGTEWLIYDVPTSVAGYSTLAITGIELWQLCERWGSSYYNDRGMASMTLYYHTSEGWSATGETVSFDRAPDSDTVSAQFRSLTTSLPTGVDQIKFLDFTSFGSSICGFNEIRFIATAETPTIPEPSSLVLVSIGLLGLLAYAWRKRK